MNPARRDLLVLAVLWKSYLTTRKRRAMNEEVKLAVILALQRCCHAGAFAPQRRGLSNGGNRNNLARTSACAGGGRNSHHCNLVVECGRVCPASLDCSIGFGNKVTNQPSRPKVVLFGKRTAKVCTRCSWRPTGRCSPRRRGARFTEVGRRQIAQQR